MRKNNAHATVLVLGAYGAVGRSIIRGLLEQTECMVAATGRNRDKLGGLAESMAHPRLAVSVLDALDAEELGRACQKADIVINCVGPYIICGRDIAETVVKSRRHYVDFAFEQFHYRKLKSLDRLAETNKVALITGAGAVVGISSILGVYAAEALAGLEKLTICYLEGSIEDDHSGFSSLMNGALEPALDNQDYIEGRYVTSKMGSDIAVRVFPDPHGEMKLLSDPSIDSLILPERLQLKTVKNYFGMGMKIPFGYFALMRLLNPYKNRIFYKWTGRIMKRLMRRNLALQLRSGDTQREPLLIVDAESKGKRMAMEVRLQRRFNGTAILPILISKMLDRREVNSGGLRTAMDIVSPDRLLQAFERQRRSGALDWTISETQNH